MMDTELKSEIIRTIICVIIGISLIIGLGLLIRYIQNPDKPSNAAVTEQPSPISSELSVIKEAAKENGCNDVNLLVAIRRAENGGRGKEFGIKGRAWGTDLRTQAGWAAATVVKNRRRWAEEESTKDFIDYLGDRYCPPSVDPIGNRNWKRNVKWFVSQKEE